MEERCTVHQQLVVASIILAVSSEANNEFSTCPEGFDFRAQHNNTCCKPRKCPKNHYYELCKGTPSSPDEDICRRCPSDKPVSEPIDTRVAAKYRTIINGCFKPDCNCPPEAIPVPASNCHQDGRKQCQCDRTRGYYGSDFHDCWQVNSSVMNKVKQRGYELTDNGDVRMCRTGTFKDVPDVSVCKNHTRCDKGFLVSFPGSSSEDVRCMRAPTSTLMINTQTPATLKESKHLSPTPQGGRHKNRTRTSTKLTKTQTSSRERKPQNTTIRKGTKESHSTPSGKSQSPTIVICVVASVVVFISITGGLVYRYKHNRQMLNDEEANNLDIERNRDERDHLLPRTGNGNADSVATSRRTDQNRMSNPNIPPAGSESDNLESSLDDNVQQESDANASDDSNTNKNSFRISEDDMNNGNIIVNGGINTFYIYSNNYILKTDSWSSPSEKLLFDVTSSTFYPSSPNCAVPSFDNYNHRYNPPQNFIDLDGVDLKLNRRFVQNPNPLSEMSDASLELPQGPLSTESLNWLLENIESLDFSSLLNDSSLSISFPPISCSPSDVYNNTDLHEQTEAKIIDEHDGTNSATEPVMTGAGSMDLQNVSNQLRLSSFEHDNSSEFGVVASKDFRPNVVYEDLSRTRSLGASNIYRSANGFNSTYSGQSYLSSNPRRPSVAIVHPYVVRTSSGAMDLDETEGDTV